MKKYKERDIVLFSGGMGGYDVHHEFLKFVRDGLIFKPDILITFDGYNDAGFLVACEEHPLLHKYQKRFYTFIEQRRPMAPDALDMRDVKEITHGMPYMNYSDVQNWTDGVRKIHAIADEFGIQYYGFFQPMLPTGKVIIDECVKRLLKEYFKLYSSAQDVFTGIPEFVKGCQKQIVNMPYITDLSNIFDYQQDIFYDVCHVTDKGNRIIMEHIYNRIESTIHSSRR